MLHLIISQLNMLLCLVNDVLDIKMILHKKYEAKLEKFNPVNILNFIEQMFQPQAEMQRTEVSYYTVTTKWLLQLTEENHI